MDDSPDSDANIEIRLGRPRQLFDSFDLSPFHERDLDEDAEAYIVDSVDEFPLQKRLRLIIHLPADQRPAGPAWVHEVKHDGYRLIVPTKRKYHLAGWPLDSPYLIERIPKDVAEDRCYHEASPVEKSTSTLAGCSRAQEACRGQGSVRGAGRGPTTETIAAELTVPERVLLFCLASDTNWVKAGVSHATANTYSSGIWWSAITRQTLRSPIMGARC